MSDIWRCCADPEVRGGKCDNCGTWIQDAQEEELVGLEEHLRDTLVVGDARRCPHHPSVATSSDDGMFDAPCGMCEAAGEEWETDPENTTRSICGYYEGYIHANQPHHPTTCQDETHPNEIPF